MNIKEDRLNEILSNVAKHNDLKNWKYTCLESMKAIENYFGVLIPVAITGSKDNCTDDITLHLLIKITPNNIDERMKKVFIYLYEAENFLYTVLRPMFANLSFLKVDDLIPKCYYADVEPGKQVLVLQDMSFEGYRRYDGPRFLDFDHLVVAITALAEFHALSVILLEEGLVPKEDPVLLPYTDTDPMEFNIALKTALKEHHKFFKNTKYEDYLKSLLTRYKCIRMGSSRNVRRMLCGHGDYWKENIIFNYKVNKPDKACIVDFQTLRLLSPPQDFLSFIIVSTDATTRINHYEKLLSTYLEVVSKNLIKKSENLAKSYCEDFEHDIKIVAEDCLITSFMGFALWYGLEEKTLLKSKDRTNKDKAIVQFTETIRNIIDDLERLGYINL